MENERLYQLALSRVPGIGPVFAKRLIEHLGDPETIFRTPTTTLEKIPGIGQTRATAIQHFKEFSILEKELAFCTKYTIRPLFYTDKDYPQRLLPHADTPILLFYKGNADLNAQKVVSVIGTRSPTDYGKQMTDTLIRDMAGPDTLVISGLAYGIDAAAHKAALQHDLPTVGVLGHGLGQIYPGLNRKLAIAMANNGGLLTEYPSGMGPENHHFPRRNRIVAAICDALVVIETGLVGGSLLTVTNALALNKKVFALPGRITDPKSAGCNSLIQTGKASCLTSGTQLLETMGWLPLSGNGASRQTSLFPISGSIATGAASGSAGELPKSLEETVLLTLLHEKGAQSLDELAAYADLNNYKVSAILLNLELSGLVVSMPGKVYKLSC
jgi:DNA processing protein